ncbi:mitochondrial cardiolipin hydrolase-like [Euwallacea similis]|uniref:mitochondrial cardiolipin hydrolase-like n=1 Tax=Euwallacea similis TaxID=1736056 RepID=UPI00344CA417
MSKLLLTLTPISLGLTALPIFLHYILKKRYQRQLQDLNKPDLDSYYECIFIDYKNFNCKPHLIKLTECGENCSTTHLKRLLHYIASAKTSVKLCMFMLTLKQVTAELVGVHKRGVKVQVIADRGMSQNAAVQSNFSYLEENGIAFKISPGVNEMMHHKFCLIDEKDEQMSKVFFGSLNLTVQAFCKNFENLVFTNNTKVIQGLSEEFEMLWERF